MSELKFEAGSQVRAIYFNDTTIARQSDFFGVFGIKLWCDFFYKMTMASKSDPLVRDGDGTLERISSTKWRWHVGANLLCEMAMALERDSLLRVHSQKKFLSPPRPRGGEGAGG